MSGTNYLIDDRKSLISATTDLDKKWATIGAPLLNGKYANGIYYINPDGVAVVQAVAISNCANKGMRTPYDYEHNSGTVLFVVAYTWATYTNIGNAASPDYGMEFFPPSSPYCVSFCVK